MSCGPCEKLKVLVLPCQSAIALPIVAHETGTWTMVYDFAGNDVIQSIAVEEGEAVQVPNIFNEKFKNKIEFYDSSGQLVNGTCYWFQTRGVPASPFASFTPPAPKSSTDIITVVASTAGMQIPVPPAMADKVVHAVIADQQALNMGQYFQNAGIIYRTDGGAFYPNQVVTFIASETIHFVAHPRTQAVINYAESNAIDIPEIPSLIRLDNVVRGIDDLGYWSFFDIFYWMVGGGSLAFKTINIVNPAKSGTAEGGLINEVRGIKGNAIDGRINTNFGASDWVAMQGNSASHLMYHYGATGISANTMITSADNFQNTYIQRAPAVGFSRCNRGTPSNTLRIDQTFGMRVARRSPANQMSVIDDNGTQTSAMSAITQELPAGMFLLYSPFGPQYSQQSLGMYAIGSFMTTGMYNDLKAAIMPNIIPGFNVT